MSLPESIRQQLRRFPSRTFNFGDRATPIQVQVINRVVRNAAGTRFRLYVFDHPEVGMISIRDHGRKELFSASIHKGLSPEQQDWLEKMLPTLNPLTRKV